ncbi:MAG: sulfocyanin-like copper-binding protein [Deltaproteobacteria bacterium]
MFRFRQAACGAIVMTFVSLGGAFAADSTINVTLWDKGDMNAAMGREDGKLGMGMGMMMADPMMAPMGVKLDVATVPAGNVTFNVTNDSLIMEHEMIVLPIVDDKTPLPYDAKTKRVDEDAAGALGEVSETASGKSGTLTLDLAPGKYMLLCNIEGHYAQGMWTILTVTE